jgi:hypothetical protein
MTHHGGHRSKQPAHATSHAPGRPAKATRPAPLVPIPAPPCDSGNPERHLRALASICPLRSGRTDPTLPLSRTRTSGPALPSAPTSPAVWALSSRAWPPPPSTGQRHSLPTRHSVAVVPPEFRGLRPACGCKCSPRLTTLLEMLHPRCRHGPTRRREVYQTIRELSTCLSDSNSEINCIFLSCRVLRREVLSSSASRAAQARLLRPPSGRPSGLPGKRYLCFSWFPQLIGCNFAPCA